MPVVSLPDGNTVDLGDNPSPDAVAHVHSVIEQQQKAGVTAPAADEGIDLIGKAEEYAPTIARTAGPLIGGVVGAVGGPVGVAAGAALGGAAGDVLAQHMEIQRGQRKGYNPLRTLAEAGSDALFAGIPMGDALVTAVAKSGTLGVVSSNAISIAEGQGVNSAGQNAIAFLTAGGLQAVGHYAGVKAKAVQEVSGVPQIEEHVSLLTKADAPTHGPDGVPTEIPAPTVVDEFGKPVRRQDVYPELAGPPKPEVGPADPAAAIATPVETGGGPTKVGQTPVEKPTGLSVSSRKEQNKQAVLDTWMEQRRPGIFEATPSKDIPPLESIPPKGDLLEPDGGMEDLGKQASDPIHDIPGNGDFNDPSDMTQNIIRYTGRTKTYFQRLEKETGYPVYQDYDKLSQANRKYQQVNKDLSNTAAKALRGTDRGDWQAILQDTAAGADGSSLQPKLRAKAQTIMRVADRALEPFGITSHDLFTEYLPALLNNDQDALAQDKWAPFQDALIQGKVNLKTSDLPRMMQQISNAGAFESQAGEVVRGLQQKYSANLDAPDAVKQAINYYTKVLDGTPDRLAGGLGTAITHIAKKFGWDVDGHGIANRIVSTQYSAMLAGRPGPVIRRLLHPIQTATGPMGFSWLAEGYRQFLTSEGRAAIESSGISAESIMNELAASGKTKLGRVVDNTVAKFMVPFGSADLASRGPVYLGTRAKILWAAEKYGDNAQTFLTKSGVGRYSPQDANIVLDLLSRGDVAGAADRGAQMMVDNTQFMYSSMERPRMFTGAGRTLGAFGVWPAQYGELLAHMGQRGANGTWYEVGRDYARFLTANAAIVGGFYEAAKFVNDETHLTDTLGWSMVSHALYTGAPGMNSLLAGANQIKQITEGRGIPQTREQAASKGKELFRTVAAPFIPMSGMGLDVIRASKEPTTARKISTYAGITRGPAPKDTGFKGYGAGKALKGF